MREENRKRCFRSGQPLNRSIAESAPARRKKKKLAKSSWFRKNEDEEVANRKQEETSAVHNTRKRKSFKKNSKESKKQKKNKRIMRKTFHMDGNKDKSEVNPCVRMEGNSEHQLTCL